MLVVDSGGCAECRNFDPKDVALQWTCALELIDQIHGGEDD